MLFVVGLYGGGNVVVDVSGSNQVDDTIPLQGVQDAGLDPRQMKVDAVVQTRLSDLPHSVGAARPGVTSWLTHWDRVVVVPQ